MKQVGKIKLVYIQLLLGMIFFGSATPVSKIITESFEPLLATGFRLAIASILLAPFAIKSELFTDFNKKNWLRLVGVSLIGIVGFTVFLLLGMKEVSGVIGSIIMSTTPAITAVGAVLFFGDKMSWKKIAAIILAVIGIVVLNLDSGGVGDGRLWLGIVLVFMAVCSEATYTLMGKQLMKKVDPLQLSGLTALCGFILLLPVLIYKLVDFNFSRVTPSNWIFLVYWGAGAFALGSWLWYSGVQKVEGSIAAGFMGVMSVSALVLSYLLLDEKFQWIHMIGFGMVFLSVILIISTHRNKAKKNSEDVSANK